MSGLNWACIVVSAGAGADAGGCCRRRRRHHHRRGRRRRRRRSRTLACPPQPRTHRQLCQFAMMTPAAAAASPVSVV